jgi:hypothetical protein
MVSIGARSLGLKGKLGARHSNPLIQIKPVGRLDPPLASCCWHSRIAGMSADE